MVSYGHSILVNNVDEVCWRAFWNARGLEETHSQRWSFLLMDIIFCG